ncbi:MAG TPA: ribosome biogenesis GTPase YlqF [Bacillota bacterium]|nr:ribosome biogenesis GTPase YlqF [Bacillota bacterium]
MKFPWFPGHMARTKRTMKQHLFGIDLVIEVLDARIPRTSRNPDIKSITENRPRVVVLAKRDLADPNETKAWLRILRADGLDCYAVNAETGEGVEDVVAGISRLAEELMLRLAGRERRPRPFRVMVIGIPNVGKSSLINRIAGRKSAKTGAKPGITRGKQWIRVGRAIELLDMPGVLSPRMDNPEDLFKLAATGALAEECFDEIRVAEDLLETLRDKACNALTARFKLSDIEGEDGHTILQLIGEKRGCLGSGGIVDISRAATIVLSEFRKGLLGRVTLDPAVDDRLEDKT